MDKFESRAQRIEHNCKPRVCLSCGAKFASEGPWNRTCLTCADATAGFGSPTSISVRDAHTLRELEKQGVYLT